jgi:hypothetical protein
MVIQKTNRLLSLGRFSGELLSKLALPFLFAAVDLGLPPLTSGLRDSAGGFNLRPECG